MASRKNLFIFFIILFSLPLIFVLKDLFLKDPPVWPDEAIFFDMANNLINKKNITSSLFGGVVPYAEVVGIGYPPFYFNILAFWTNIFGSSIEGVRSLSLILSFASLFVFFFIAKLITNSNYLASLGVLLLASDIHFSRASRIGRMDMLCFFLITISIYFFTLAIKKPKKYFYLLAGIFAGLAVFTHTMGFIAISMIFIYLLIEKTSLKEKFLKMFIVATPVFFTILLWFLSFGDRFGLFVNSYKDQIFTKTAKGSYGFLLFQTDFIWWFTFVLYSIIFFIFIFVVFKNFNKINLFLLVGFIVSAIILFLGKEGWYIIYFQPFLTLIELVVLKKVWELKNKTFLNIVLALMFILFLNNLNILFFNNQNSFAGVESSIPGFKNKNYDYHDFTKRITEQLPKDKRISISLVAIPDPYFDLRQNEDFKLYQIIMGYNKPDKTYVQLLDSSDYLIFSWLPYKILNEYISKNTDNYTVVKQPNGYSAIIIKFVPRDKRK